MNFLLDKMRAMDNSREEFKLLNFSDNSSIILLLANIGAIVTQRIQLQLLSVMDDLFSGH